MKQRIDTAGRDVTDLPGLWSEDDTVTDIDPIMQAAERLRLVGQGMNSAEARELYRDVYRWRGTDWEIAAIRKDRETLSDFMLSILPKGKRPVGVMADPSFRPGWMIGATHKPLKTPIPGFCVINYPIFQSEGECLTERHWQLLDQLVKHAAAR